ncbi:hypothetical protein AC579_9621 [Pseudocercospora musae]|uniref:LSM complex subunit LSM4 n=1 Tax=Pseudocercospora musae TaxID=113226 RepID=A0A139ITF9_9PEZI|nr:hypothetical protein AC579_9621 [Pseudocercospora musae]
MKSAVADADFDLAMYERLAFASNIQNRPSPWALATMLPLSLLNAAQGHPMLVELKTGDTLNGHLVNCDTYMNLTLKEVVQTSPEGDKFFRLAECYVRGNNIKYLRIPDEVVDTVKEQQALQQAQRAEGGEEGEVVLQEVVVAAAETIHFAETAEEGKGIHASGGRSFTLAFHEQNSHRKDQSSQATLKHNDWRTLQDFNALDRRKSLKLATGVTSNTAAIRLEHHAFHDQGLVNHPGEQ